MIMSFVIINFYFSNYPNGRNRGSAEATFTSPLYCKNTLTLWFLSLKFILCTHKVLVNKSQTYSWKNIKFFFLTIFQPLETRASRLEPWVNSSWKQKKYLFTFSNSLNKIILVKFCYPLLAIFFVRYALTHTHTNAYIIHTCTYCTCLLVALLSCYQLSRQLRRCCRFVKFCVFLFFVVYCCFLLFSTFAGIFIIMYWLPCIYQCSASFALFACFCCVCCFLAPG